jgi:hypothetical protein
LTCCFQRTLHRRESGEIEPQPQRTEIELQPKCSEVAGERYRLDDRLEYQLARPGPEARYYDGEYRGRPALASAPDSRRPQCSRSEVAGERYRLDDRLEYQPARPGPRYYDGEHRGRPALASSIRYEPPTQDVHQQPFLIDSSYQELDLPIRPKGVIEFPNHKSHLPQTGNALPPAVELDIWDQMRDVGGLFTEILINAEEFYIEVEKLPNVGFAIGQAILSEDITLYKQSYRKFFKGERPAQCNH